MKNVASQTLVKGILLPFLNQHWFKIGIAVLALYAFLSKDFAFQIDIQAPGEPSTLPAEPAVPPTPLTANPKLPLTVELVVISTK